MNLERKRTPSAHLGCQHNLHGLELGATPLIEE
jgi:hypothetical protein